MRLFQGIVNFNMQLFSPQKYDIMESEDIGMVMTPVGKGSLPEPIIVDEDSGLGMDKVESGSSSEDEESDKFQIRRSKRSLLNFSGICQKKRPHPDDDEDGGYILPPVKSRREHSPLKRSFSYTYGESTVVGEQDEEIKTIVDRFVDEDDLIADGSSSYSLPTIQGKHGDLKSITPETLAHVINGAYDSDIASYRIIDCRYPYEYDGGHIMDAENIYTQEQMLKLLHNQSAISRSGKRHILIFHCEFSSERGPKMIRFLRKKDREINVDNYPALCYPEIYLLHNGYKLFHEKKQEYCDPKGYTPMLHKDYGNDLRHFRLRSKTFAYGERRRDAHKKFEFLN